LLFFSEVTKTCETTFYPLMPNKSLEVQRYIVV
jgi:hypothetical protein